MLGSIGDYFGRLITERSGLARNPRDGTTRGESSFDALYAYHQLGCRGSVRKWHAGYDFFHTTTLFSQSPHRQQKNAKAYSRGVFYAGTRAERSNRNAGKSYKVPILIFRADS